VKADGVIGQITLAAAQAVAEAGKIKDLIARLCARRMVFLRSLTTFKHFGRGWTRRVEGDQPGFQERDIGVIDRAIILAGTHAPSIPGTIPAPTQAAPGKAEPQDVSAPSVLLEATKSPEALGLIGTITSAIGALSSTAGPIAWAVAAVMVMGAGYAIYRLVRREVTA
jgi:lysozyme family protein